MARQSELLIVAEDADGERKVARTFAADKDFYLTVTPEARAAAEHITIHLFVNGQQRLATLAELMDDWTAPLRTVPKPGNGGK